MRWMFVCAALVLYGTSSVHANPLSKAPPRSANRGDSQKYAKQLMEILSGVAARYIRPVERAELAASALRGLYEASEVPVPPNFTSELQQAASSNQQLYRFIDRLRGALGDPEPLRGDGAILASLRALARSLDPYCAVLTGAELERGNRQTPNHGFGLELLGDSEIGPLIIKTVAPGGPAQKAGLRPGDQITHVDGRLIGEKLSSASRFAQGGQLRLTLLPAGGKSPRDVRLKADSFQTDTVLGVMRRADNSWDYFLDRKHRIAHVRIGFVDIGTPEELSQVLENLRDEGVRALILDLRWSPGGYLNEARAIAGLFRAYNLNYFLHPLPGNLLTVAYLCRENHWSNAVVQFRDGRRDYQFEEDEPGLIKFPVIVLVNEETSGGAELIAAVLQDNRRALIAGQRTRGKASVQTMWKLTGEEPCIPLSVPIPGTGLKLTNGFLIRPSGKNLNRFPDSKRNDDWGVRPDPKLQSRVSAELSHQLRDWWQLQDLRPGSSNESLPLDDPANDPQRQAAWQAVLDLLK